MTSRFTLSLMLIAGTLTATAGAQTPQPEPAKPAETQPVEGVPPMPEAVEVLRAEAAGLLSLVENPDVKATLISTSWLPYVDTRTLYMDARWTRAYTPEEFEKLTEEDKKGLSPVPIDPYRYYYTKYGSPMAYMRPLDIAANAIGGPMPLRKKRVMDYGYGTIGHLRLMASQSLDVVGVEVDPMLRALYTRPDDTGKIPGAGLSEVPPDGHLTLVHGLWPKDADVAKKVGGGYDLITSKNTLKNGFINPAVKIDPKMMVDLGVPQDQFVAKVAEALKPGGLFLIYNICPKQKPEGEGYIPWADGRCPFPREMLEKAGFEVLEYNKDDSAMARRFGAALGWDKGPRPMDLENDCFAEYTLVRKKAPAAPVAQ